MKREDLGWLALALLLATIILGSLALETVRMEDYPVNWVAEESYTDTISETLAEGEATSTLAQANATGLRAFRAELTWTDDVGSADRFRLTIVAPDGTEVGQREGQSGRITLEVPIQPPPEIDEVSARDAEEAELFARSYLDPEAGQGNWTVLVELLEAPGENTAGMETEPDGSNAFELQVRITTHHPELGLAPG